MTLSAEPSPRRCLECGEVGSDWEIRAGHVVDDEIVGASESVESICSTPSVSIVMLPTLRKKRTRSPFADASKFSSALLPLNTIVSAPSWPSTTSLPSPGSHWNTSSSVPSRAMSLPCWPSTKSLPSPPSRMSMPLLPRWCRHRCHRRP